MKRLTLFALLASLPLQAHAQLPVQATPTVSITPTGYNLDWHGHSTRTYFLEYSADLTNWAYMPVIESGTDAALGYGFATSGDKLFLRVRYTDVPTSTPNSADFDGDGISNWDEIRIGGTGTDPFKWDTDGDGKSDYYTDKDNNLLADGWEIQHYGSIGTADPNANDDEDTLTNHEESLMGSDPNNKDSDGDSINDDEEAVWWDSKVKWPRSVELQYAVIELSGLNPVGTYVDHIEMDPTGDLHTQVVKNDWTIQSISNGGHVLVVEDKRGLSGSDGALNPANITDAIKNHVWDPATGAWSLLKNDQITSGQALAVGTATNKNGVTAGYAWIPLEDSNGDPGTGPGVERVAVKWADSVATTLPTMVGQPTGTPHGTFSSDGTYLEIADMAKGIGISSDGNYLLAKVDTNGSSLMYGTNTVFENITQAADYEKAVMTRDGDVFYPDWQNSGIKVRISVGFTEIVVDQVDKPSSIKIACRINHGTTTNLAAYGDGLWARQYSLWTRVKPHPVNPLTGVKGISDDLTVLLNDGKHVMRNGKIIELDSAIVSDDWQDFRMEKMNDHGVMVGRAKKNETEDKLVLLVPIQLLQPELDDQGAIVQEAGVDKLIPVEEIRPSRWLNAWVWSPQLGIYEFDETFVETDPDRFYIRSPMAWQNSDPNSMRLLAIGAGDSTKLNFEMISDDGDDVYQSKALILVTDEVDDNISFNPDMGTDDDVDDLTHQVLGAGASLDSYLNLLIPSSFGSVSNNIWIKPKVKQCTHELDVDLVLLVREADEENEALHQFYENRVQPLINDAKSIYARSGIEFETNFSVKVVPDALWNSALADDDLSYGPTEDEAIIEHFRNGVPTKPVMFLTSFTLNGNTDRGFAYGYPQYNTYGYGFVSLKANLSDLHRVTLAHEVGHILGHVNQSLIPSNIVNSRPYPAASHVSLHKIHDCMCPGQVHRQDNAFTDTKRFDFSQEKLFKTSEFVTKK